jgi:hypothetical protein
MSSDDVNNVVRFHRDGISKPRCIISYHVSPGCRCGLLDKSANSPSREDHKTQDTGVIALLESAGRCPAPADSLDIRITPSFDIQLITLIIDASPLLRQKRFPWGALRCAPVMGE